MFHKKKVKKVIKKYLSLNLFHLVLNQVLLLCGILFELLYQAFFFIGNPGLLTSMPSEKPIDFFCLLANDKLFDLILCETNMQR